MKINEATLGLDCEVTIRHEGNRDDEKTFRRTFFGIDNTPEGLATILQIEKNNLRSAGLNPNEFQIFVH